MKNLDKQMCCNDHVVQKKGEDMVCCGKSGLYFNI